jgi:DNA-binding transcriptional LysR family regulator
MDLRSLRYFVAVAEELHFRRAAERLRVTQAAVSQQVRKLEKDLGVQLVERTPPRVALTAAGEAFVVAARRVLHEADRAQRAALSARLSTDGQLRVGHPPDLLPAALPQAMGLVATATPGVEIVLETHPTHELVERVHDRRLDAAVVCLPAPVSGLRVTPFGEEGVIVALQESRRVVGTLSIGPQQLEGVPVLAMPRAVNPGFFDGLISAWRDAGIAATFVEVAEPNVEHVLLAVAARAGAALLPESTRQRFAAHGVRFLPLQPSPTCEVAVITYPRHTRVATSAFLRVASAMATPAAAIQPVAAAS